MERILENLGGATGCWQPIETAPKDRVVDLWANGRRWTDCRFGPVDYKTTGPAWGRDGGKAQEHGYSGKTVVEVENPTHWMPPPNPPS